MPDSNENFRRPQQAKITTLLGSLETFEREILALLRRPEDFDAGEYRRLLDAIDSHWNRNYPGFAENALTEGRRIAERQRFLEAHRDVGRNDICPCGSGKKFKKCCLAED